MKNANSRFVRVLALVLVVLMVVPAALVGCGSNKANNAAISEALAAAEAARKEAEEAKAAADAAAAEAAAKAAEEAAKLLEEANKKAEEALKAAEEAKKELEEAKKTTAAPETTAPVVPEDMKVVADYAYQMLNSKEFDFIKTYLVYAYGVEEEDIADLSETEIKQALIADPIMLDSANPVYAEDDVKAMVALYDAAKVAIYQANTVDYINTVVANFVAAIKEIPTYVERVIAAYEAIDFASKYDVIDVVYANAFVDKALEELSGDAENNFVAALTKYGEEEIDILAAIDTEYYRYTGETGEYADTSAVEEVLYADMYEEAGDILDAVVALAGADLDVADLGYAADIDDAVAAAIKMYAAWNNAYFVKAKDTELVKYYEAFRQAFVGEAYIVEKEGDYVWAALNAFEARATELLAAAADYKATFKSALTKVAGYTVINYWKQAEQVATVKAALDAWKTKYNFKDDENGNADANVLAIIGAATYADYEDNALEVEYFVYLEKTASSVNVDDFLKAYNSDLDENDAVVTFDFAKYGSAVASALDWYFGKEKNGVRQNGFKDIVPSAVKGFGDLADADYSVAALIADDNANIAKIFDNLFDLDIVDDDAAAFDSMKAAYEALLAKKKAADLINKNIAVALEKGVDIDVLDDVETFIGANPEAVLNPENDDDLYLAVAGSVGTWAAGYIAKGDANFASMINWEGIEALYANYKASTAEIEKVAAKIALEYIAWKGTYDADDDVVTFAGKVFEDLKPVEVNIFSYDMIKEIVDTYEAIQDIDKGNTPVVLAAADDETYTITLETVTDYCYEMLVYFYDIVDSLNKNLYAEIYKGYPLLDKAAYKEVSFPYATRDNEWFSLTTQDHMFELIEALHGTLDSKVKAGIKSAFGTSKVYLGYSTRQFGTVKVDFYGDDGETVVEQLKTVSYQYAIASVDPDKYTTKNTNGTVASFDGAAYKAAVDSSIASVYTSYLKSYAKDTSRASALTAIVDIIATQTLNAGLWNFADDIAIYGDIYDFSVNVDATGKAWQFVVTDADGDVVGAAKAGETVTIEVKYDGEDYDVTLTPTLVDGKFVVVPALDAEDVDFTIYDLLDDINADDVDALVYDVRDAVDAIAANLDKVTNIPLLGNNKATLDTFTADQIKSMFAIEAKNDFWVEFNTLKGRMYGSATKAANQFVFGNYISNFADVLGDATAWADDANEGLTDEAIAVKAKLLAASVMVYEKVKGMTPETNTIEEVINIFNTFKNDVKKILGENGYTVAVVDANAAYEQITITAPVATPIAE